MNKALSQQDKERYCALWAQSGMSRVNFCRGHGIAPSTFQGWYDAYKKKAVREGLFSPMVPESVGAVVEEQEHISCEIRFPNETQLVVSLPMQALVSIIGGMCHAARAIW